LGDESGFSTFCHFGVTLAPVQQADSTGRRNTSITEVSAMVTKDWSKKTSDVSEGARRQWRADRALRPAMRSPGRPDPSRVVQRQFWWLIATGVTTVDASVAVGVSWPVGARWFRHAGGMPPISLAEVSATLENEADPTPRFQASSTTRTPTACCASTSQRDRPFAMARRGPRGRRSHAQQQATQDPRMEETC